MLCAAAHVNRMLSNRLVLRAICNAISPKETPFRAVKQWSGWVVARRSLMDNKILKFELFSKVALAAGF